MKAERLFLRSRAAIGLVLAAGLPLLAGCCYLPVPTTHENHGMKVTRDDVRFIQVGKTTRAEVIDHLGTNYVSLPRERAIAYPFETGGVSFEWYKVVWLGFVVMTDKTDVETSPTGSYWQAFFLAFDDHAVVQAVRFERLSMNNQSLDEQLDQWAAAQWPKNGLAECRK